MNQLDHHNIIILEPNQARRDHLRSIISRWGYIPFLFEKETICLDNLKPLKPGLVISGSLSAAKTFRFINTLKTINWRLPVLIISNDYAVHDFINMNGFADVSVIGVTFEPSDIKKAISKVKANRPKSITFQDFPLIIGQSPAMLKIKRMIPELSRSKETVLIRGETGTGKGLVAKAIHCRSDRGNNPFIKVNSTDLPHELFKGILFGYGTDASGDVPENKKGKFEAANTGTIFLDDIEKISATLQANLLHALEEGGISKLGGATNEKLDVRIIAATNADLDMLIQRGKFRKDLYFRLNIIEIEIPSLRDRTEDIPLIADYFADKFCMEFGKSCCQMSPKTKNIFSRYHWPGNVRELYNVVKSSVLLGHEESIINQLCLYNQKDNTADFIEGLETIDALAELSEVKNYIKDINKISLKDICREFITRTEKKLMQKALQRTNWNRKKAAMMLKISYKSLLNKIKAYNLA